MLSTLTHLPDGFLQAGPRDLHRVLAGPTLIHLPGRRTAPLFVCVLLHGNEDTGLRAVQRVLSGLAGRELPRALSLFVGNVAAAAQGLRRLPGQPDYNRVWPGADTSGTPEHAMAEAVVAQLRGRGVFASIDLHNNTGLNPHYGCVNRLEPSFLHLAALFARTAVFFRRPLGVQSEAFARLCPAVTVECGKPGDPAREAHAAEFIAAALHLDHFPPHTVPAHDLALYHTVATVKVPGSVSFGFGDAAAATLQFEAELDRLNFRDLPAGTRLGRLTAACGRPLVAEDEEGRDVTDRYFELRGAELCLRTGAMPSMLTLDSTVIRQDCLCYLMERLQR